MKVTFGQQTISDKEQKKIESNRVQNSVEHMSIGQTFHAIFGKNREMIGRETEKGKSLIELQQEAANTNVAVQQDYMTLAANTLSEEDYAKMQEEGFDFGSMDPKEAVTIVDKIKAELARSGQHIAGYTDDLSMETLSQALGSETLARAVAESFREADVPLTKENVSGVAQAWMMCSQLQPMGDGSYQYLIDNELAAEIWNLYLAQNSGAGSGSSVPRFYAENVQGYFSQTATGTNGAELLAQMDRIIEQSGSRVNEESRGNAMWLLEKGLPLTVENLKNLEQLKEVQLPVSEEQFAHAAAVAVADGKSPIHASLSGEGKTLYEKAVETEEYYQSQEVWEATLGNLTARRQLEEVRLRMCAEVNIKLLRSGFAIDTAPMEALVEALREAERQLADQYFPGDAEAVEKYQTYRKASTVVVQLPGLPADILGEFAEGQSTATLEVFHGEGRALQETYEKAQTSYEMLLTSPRADLGDSIKKAFANVDDILQDLGAELTEENRRAIRILGYNRMEITEENMEAVRTADRQVQKVLEKLTPAATLQMIRDGINPLEKTFEELEQYFDALPSEYGQEAESYSKFLYQLEQNKEITPEERESYIGVFRLVRQLEKADGAAVGALVNIQAELHFTNLLAAIRSSKARFIDAKVSDELGTVTELIRNGASISDQIAKAFVKEAKEAVTTVSQSEEAAVEYNKEQLETLRQAVVDADKEGVAMLQRGQMPENAENLLAARILTQSVDNIFEEADKRRTKTQNQNMTEVSHNTEESETSKTGKSLKLWQSLEDKEAFAKEYEELAGEALETIEETTFEQADSSLDVRRMQLNHKQLTIATALSKQEEYFLPMYIGEKLARVHLTLNRDGEEKGSVTVEVALSDKSSIQAAFRMENGALSGIFTSDASDEVMKLEKIADNFKQEAKNNWTLGEILVVTGGRAAVESLHTGEYTPVENAQLYRVAKVFLKSVQQGEESYEN